MQALDLQGEFGDYLVDEDRKIPTAHLDSVCKKNQSEACRYICLSVIGFVCTKNTPLKDTVDDMVAKGNIKCSGDNCGGLCVENPE